MTAARIREDVMPPILVQAFEERAIRLPGELGVGSSTLGVRAFCVARM
jgi:hypothetical protein